MFPDSDIAENFTCGENKISYIVTFGISPYLKDIMDSEMKNVKYFVLMYDESHNDSLEQKQLDVHVKYWDEEKNQVVTKYYDSQFMGHGRAEGIL